jgi:hypothetical protein
MAVNDTFTNSTVGLGDTNEFIVDGSSSGTGAVRITEIDGTASAEIYREVDTNDDGSWAYRSQVDITNAEFHSQLNGLRVSQTNNIRLVVKNVSGGQADFAAIGYEVDS